MKHQHTWIHLGTSVSPDGKFVYGLHEPHFKTLNLRQTDVILSLGQTDKGLGVENQVNFPEDDVYESNGGPVFEIANPFPFRGTTYIGKAWADAKATDPTGIAIASLKTVSLTRTMQKIFGSQNNHFRHFFEVLPESIRLALATTSTDPDDLKWLAQTTCQFIYDEHTGKPVGLTFAPDDQGRMRPQIYNHRLYDAVANNSYLDNVYKEVMVLRPGIQGTSEIVGEWQGSEKSGRVFEYLRRNSYIPWGHYAANMAHDTVRYAIGDITADDIHGLRHLYYQRTYVRLAQELGIQLPKKRKTLSIHQLENLRQSIIHNMGEDRPLAFTATLWGWNYGFDYAPTGYRLHASHQQIHQQFAMIPETVAVSSHYDGLSKPAYASGDMICDFIGRYRHLTGQSFFDCYESAIKTNERMDGRDTAPCSLVVHEDDQVMLFVPKAQTSQWELQLMPKKTVGNVLEADHTMRQSLDIAMLVAMRVLTHLGATMITVIEYSRRFNSPEKDQRLLYAFLPRLPESPGAFSEAQLRWINGHYPEDFALACRLHNPQRL